MKIALLFAIAGATMLQSIPVAPPLQVVSVVPSTAPNDSRCAVTLYNPYSTRAVAWVIERLPERLSGASFDFATSRSLGIHPSESSTVLMNCDPNVPLLIDVGAVLYEDGAVSGDLALLRTHILQRRRQEAAALRELAELLSVARLTGAQGTYDRELSTLIHASAGPRITSMAKTRAETALRNIIRRHPDRLQDAAFMRQTLLSDIEFMVRALEAFQVQ